MTDELDLNAHIATRVRALRGELGLTLDGLAERSGVSRSMISAVERGETSPTAVLLERLAAGLNVTLAALFDRPNHKATPVARFADHPPWRDPASGYIRRNVSPAGVSTPIQIVEVEMPPGAHVTYETGPRDALVHQQVWVFDGALTVTVGDATHQLGAGDCLAFVLDRPTGFHNPTPLPTRYAVVIVNQTDIRR